jgi:protein-disulfide isomerase
LALSIAPAALAGGKDGSGRNLPAITPAEIAQQKSFGMKNAPIEIQDFTDFECPACRALYMQTLRPLINDYVATGKVYLVHHDFPLPIHPYSRKAAYYADAAAAIGRFETVERVLFTTQPTWAATGKITPELAKVLTPAELKQVKELALTPEIQNAVQQDIDLGQRLNIRETPTIFITHDGKTFPVVGVVEYPILRRYLDDILKK